MKATLADFSTTTLYGNPEPGKRRRALRGADDAEVREVEERTRVVRVGTGIRGRAHDSEKKAPEAFCVVAVDRKAS